MTMLAPTLSNPTTKSPLATVETPTRSRDHLREAESSSFEDALKTREQQDRQAVREADNAAESDADRDDAATAVESRDDAPVNDQPDTRDQPAGSAAGEGRSDASADAADTQADQSSHDAATRTQGDATGAQTAQDSAASAQALPEQAMLEAQARRQAEQSAQENIQRNSTPATDVVPSPLEQTTTATTEQAAADSAREAVESARNGSRDVHHVSADLTPATNDQANADRAKRAEASAAKTAQADAAAKQAHGAAAATQPTDRARTAESQEAIQRILDQHLAPERTAGRDAGAVMEQSRAAGTSQAPAAVRAAHVETAINLEQLTQQMGAEAAARTGARPTAVLNASGGVTAAGAESAAPLADLRTPEDQQFAGRVMRGLNAMINQRGGVMNMKLTPPELGTLRIQMSINQGAVTAQFTASTEQAQQMLERGMSGLRTALQQHGLTVERLGVSLNGTEQQSSGQMRNESGDAQQHAAQQERQDADRDAAGGQSRGRRDDATARGHQPAPQPAGFDHDLETFRSAAEAARNGGEA
jgi:flagellar hook-length control protein FliK